MYIHGKTYVGCTQTRKQPLEEWVWQLHGLEVSGVSTGILPKHDNKM